jgi:hypothetical protein
MIDSLDVDRIITERITLKSIPLHHSRLIHKFIEEAANEMKEIIRENRDMQYVKIWSEKKTNDLNKILEKEKIEPATPAYITIKQICDAAMHFVAEYRANKSVKT